MQRITLLFQLIDSPVLWSLVTQMSIKFNSTRTLRSKHPQNKFSMWLPPSKWTSFNPATLTLIISKETSRWCTSQLRSPSRSTPRKTLLKSKMNLNKPWLIALPALLTKRVKMRVAWDFARTSRPNGIFIVDNTKKEETMSKSARNANSSILRLTASMPFQTRKSREQSKHDKALMIYSSIQTTLKRSLI